MDTSAITAPVVLPAPVPEPDYDALLEEVPDPTPQVLEGVADDFFDSVHLNTEAEEEESTTPP